MSRSRLYNIRTGNLIELIVCDGDRTIINFNGSKYASSWDMLGYLHCSKDKWEAITDMYINKIQQTDCPEEQEQLFEDWAKRDARALAGFQVYELQKLDLPYTQGVMELFMMIQGCDVKKAIVSGGIDLVYSRVKKELLFDYCVANVLEVKRGVLTGELRMVVGLHNKKQCLDNILESQDLRIPYKHMIMVGDNHNDRELLQTVKDAGGLGLAIHPEDETVVNAANHTIKSFTDIMQYVEIK